MARFVNIEPKPHGRVFATCGANGDPYGYDLVGKTVGYAIPVLQPELNFAADARPHVNGEPVEGDYVFKDNDRLQFPKPAGNLG